MVSLGPFFYIHYRKIFRRTPNTEAGLGDKFPKDGHLFLYTFIDELLSSPVFFEHEIKIKIKKYTKQNFLILLAIGRVRRLGSVK